MIAPVPAPLVTVFVNVPSVVTFAIGPADANVNDDGANTLFSSYTTILYSRGFRFEPTPYVRLSPHTACHQLLLFIPQQPNTNNQIYSVNI